MKGVHGVLVSRNVKRWALRFPGRCTSADGALVRRRRQVRYVGEPVAVVIAEPLSAWKVSVEVCLR